jgi:hypothetical protein
MLPHPSQTTHARLFVASQGLGMSRDLMKWMLVVIGIPMLATLALKLFVAPLIN